MRFPTADDPNENLSNVVGKKYWAKKSGWSRFIYFYYFIYLFLFYFLEFSLFAFNNNDLTG